MNYQRIQTVGEPKAARFRKVDGWDDFGSLREGVSLADSIPKDAAFKMSKEFPDLIALYDFLPNIGHVLVVSQRVKELLEAEKVPQVEYLPVAVVNHKGRKEKAPYFILNLLALVDCADPVKTKHVINDLDEDMWLEVKNLTLVEKKIPPDLQLLRVRHVAPLMLVRKDLAAKLKAAKLRGFALTEVADYRD